MKKRDRVRKNAINNQYYHRNKDRIREKQKVRSAESYLDPETKEKKLLAQKEWRKNNKEKYMHSSIRTRCKKSGREFSLDVTDIVIPEYCPVLNIKLEMDGSRDTWLSSPSLDRIDNTRGYVKGNIAVMSMRANRIKGIATLEELKLLVAYLERMELEKQGTIDNNKEKDYTF